jgi:outer membrane protein
MKKPCLLIAFCFILSFVYAQEKSWTLSDCIHYAVEHSNDKKKQEAQIAIYKQNYKEAIGGLLPSLKASADGSFSFGRVLDKDTYQYVNTNTFYNEYQIYSSVTLFDGFSQITKTRMERMNRLKGEEQLRQLKEMLAYETMELFFNVQYYQGTVRLANLQLEESLGNLKKAKKMEELGLKSTPDMAEMEAQASQNKYLLVKQQNLLEQEQIKLQAKMNYPINQTFAIAGYDSLMLVDSTKENPLTIYEQASSFSPKAFTAQKSLKASQMAVGVARGHLFPTLSLYGGYGTYFTRLMNGSSYTPFKQQFNDNQSSYFGLSLSVPLFSGFSRSAEFQRSKQQLKIAQSDYDDTLRSLYSDIEQTVADAHGTAKEYLHAQKQLESMETAHRLNVKKYNMGMISALELSTSANRLLQAQVEELYANLKYQLKHRLLEYYKGKSFN